MYKGELTKGREFFNLLIESDEFNIEMGKVALSAGRLETELISYFIRNGVRGKVNQATLGQLIKIEKKNNLLDKNLSNALKLICKQRNYLTHNIYALLTERIKETILEGRDLIDTDVLTYTERAWQLRINLI